MEIKTGALQSQNITMDDGSTEFNVDVRVLCVRPNPDDDWIAYVAPVPHPDVEDIIYAQAQQDGSKSPLKEETRAVLSDENSALVRELKIEQEKSRKLKNENKKLKKELYASEKRLLHLALGKLGISMIEEPGDDQD